MLQAVIAEGGSDSRTLHARAEHGGPALAEVGEVTWESDHIQTGFAGTLAEILLTDPVEGHSSPRAPVVDQTTQGFVRRLQGGTMPSAEPKKVGDVDQPAMLRRDEIR